MDKLKPCPFCGTSYIDFIRHDYYAVRCDSCECWMGYYYTEAEAIEAWNTRHENTCHPKDKGEHLSGTDCPAWECSKCGELFEAGANFCSNCGARVIS